MAVEEGLRARKKRRTREAIAAAAMRLFERHGFDAVTVADVARAADVSEKTVYNHFPTKEDLVTHHGEERHAALVAAIRALPEGASIVEPFRAETAAMLDQVERGPVEKFVAVPRLVAGSATLRDRLFLGWEQEAASLTPAVAEAGGRPPDSLEAAVVARTLAWTHRLTFRAAFRRLLAGERREDVAAALREESRRAYDLVERGLGGYRAVRRG